MFKKTNFAGYEKDEASNLVINKNKDEYTLYVQNRERAKEFRRMASEIDKMKKEMAEMKKILNELILKKSDNQ